MVLYYLGKAHGQPLCWSKGERSYVTRDLNRLSAISQVIGDGSPTLKMVEYIERPSINGSDMSLSEGVQGRAHSCHPGRPSNGPRPGGGGELLAPKPHGKLVDQRIFAVV